MSIRVGIMGAAGYTGEELLRVLTRHPNAELVFATSEQEQEKRLGQRFPFLLKWQDLKLCSAQAILEKSVDCVFLCLPAGQSAMWAEIFLQKGAKVVDLGADFRFADPAEYQRWYGLPHPAPQLLARSIYGLPEWHRREIKQADIIGNPGCYPTAVLLGLLPLIQNRIAEPDSIVIDAKSGVSGAGRTPNSTTHFVEVNENITAYKPGRTHRHVGEIEQELSKKAAQKIQVIFAPHLIPMTRGILASVYFSLIRRLIKADVTAMLQESYRDEPFVQILAEGLPNLAMVNHSNRCAIAVEIVAESNAAILFAAIDNLGKGASWQAVQNMNIMFNLDETTGLL